MRIAVVWGLLMTLTSAAQALTVTGTAEVTRPYSFTLEGYQVYLLGVDSIELQQSCTVDQRRWDCWAAAQRQLELILSEGVVTCESVVGPDDKQRMIASCTIGGQDVGARFVESGFGLAIPKETDRYVEAEAEARAAGRGLWQGNFVPPSAWRSFPFSAKSDRPAFVAAGPMP